MRKLAVLASLMLVASAGAQYKPSSTPPPAPAPQPVVMTQAPEPSLESAKRIERDAAIKLVDQKKAVFVDVRTESTYEVGHIKGALSIPGSQLAMRITELPPKKTIITYCACHAEETAGLAVAILKAHGLKNAFALKGGWNEWRDANLPIEGISVR